MSKKNTRQTSQREVKDQMQEMMDARFLDFLNHDTQLHRLHEDYASRMAEQLHRQAVRFELAHQRLQLKYMGLCCLTLIGGVFLGGLLCHLGLM
jgi:hypothetical protein